MPTKPMTPTETKQQEPRRWYVDTTVKKSGDGSIKAPFKTLREAHDAATEGDYVVTRRGQVL